MIININQIKNHCQKTETSCVPMSVECVLKLLNLMPASDFSLQEDNSKFGNSDWISKGFSYPEIDSKVTFAREYFLPDIGLELRGEHFIQDYFVPLFNTIDEELNQGRYVIISLQSSPTPTQYHMEVVYDKVNDNEYKTVTLYFKKEGPYIFESQNLKQRVKEMNGTDILTYKWLKKE